MINYYKVKINNKYIKDFSYNFSKCYFDDFLFEYTLEYMSTIILDVGIITTHDKDDSIDLYFDDYLYKNIHTECYADSLAYSLAIQYINGNDPLIELEAYDEYNNVIINNETTITNNVFNNNIKRNAIRYMKRVLLIDYIPEYFYHNNIIYSIEDIEGYDPILTNKSMKVYSVSDNDMLMIKLTYDNVRVIHKELLESINRRMIEIQPYSIAIENLGNIL